ncbi:MAG TPA: C25 family cysteine peptidase, partial [Candidatus Eisenbacteria bacterium]
SYQEAVRTAPYAQVTPNFITCYGTNPAVGNADITNDIQAGVGLVGYFGHGSRGSWWHWPVSAPADSFAFANAQALNNVSQTPVVWSLACETGDLTKTQSLASGFMKNTHGGAVSFYGAVDDVYGDSDQVLDDSLFQAVYGRGITREGQAIVRAEHALLVADPQFGFDAVIKFVLYGDPEMEIKRHNPGGPWLPINIVAPLTLFAPCPGADCCPTCPAPTVDIQAQDATGAPIARVKVGLWKPDPGGGDELLDNRYTGADGWVHIPAPMITGGMLYYGFDDGDGRAGLDSILVEPPADVAGAGTRPPGLTAVPSVTSGATRFAFGRPLASAARVSVFAVDGRLVRALDAPAGAASLAWDGRDREGRRVGPGLYLAQLQAGPARARTRIVILR